MEEAIAQVNRVKTIYANASRNSCFLRVEFQRGTDVQLAFAEMKDRLDRVMPDLPDEIEQIGVRRWNQNDVPIMQGAFVFAGDQVDAPLLIENYLDPALSRVTGVGNVQLWGLQNKEVLVELDQGKVRGHGVNVSETVSILRDQADIATVQIIMGDNSQGFGKVQDVSDGGTADLVVVDDLAQARIESGELIVPASTGVVMWAQLRELWQVVAGEVPGRTEADDITLFKSLGMALWDVVAAKAVYEKAVTRGVGTTLDW